MKEINIKVDNITPKQWTNLLIELNLIKKSWRSYGVTLDIQTPEIKKILSWGTRKYDAKE